MPALAPPCVKPLALYRPRDPQASDLWRLMDEHFESFQQVYDERFAAKYAYWRPVVERSVEAFLKCGDLQEGFARVRCPKCKHEMFVAYSCKQRCTCPSCHQKRTLLTAIHVAEEVCFPVAHRQVVLTLPKRLRLHTRFDRKLLGKLCTCAWSCLQAEVQRLLGRDDVVPGMIAAIQTHGELLHWNPHFHMLLTCGAYTPQGEFLELPELDIQRLEAAWQEAVFALYLAEFTQHIPPQGAHLIRYYGFYSNKSRGMRKKAAAEQAEEGAKPSDADDASGAAPSRCTKTWAMLIKRVYESDPLTCPRCGSEMNVVAFIDPPQGDVIEKILRHCGLWQGSAPRPPPEVAGVVHDLDGCFSDSQAGELTFVDMDTFEATL